MYTRLPTSFAAAVVLAAGISLIACQKPKEKSEAETSQATGQAMPAQSEKELSAPLAVVDDVTITVGEFQERINRQSPYLRARYNSLEQKKEFLDNLIRFEVLAREAYARNYDKQPDVVRTLKQVMIQKLMKDEFQEKFKPEDISEDEMQAFYKAHFDEYNKPEEVRVSAIILAKKGAADKAAAEALGDTGKTNKGFRQLVSQHSIDEDTKIRGGDLRYFSRETKDIPAPVVEAAFNLEKTGDVAGPIDGKNGKFFVLKQTGRRHAVTKSFDEVKRQIQNRLYRDKRTEAQKNFIDELRKKADIKVFDDNLDKIRIDTSAGVGGDPHGHGMPAMPGPAGEPVPAGH